MTAYARSLVGDPAVAAADAIDIPSVGGVGGGGTDSALTPSRTQASVTPSSLPLAPTAPPGSVPSSLTRAVGYSVCVAGGGAGERGQGGGGTLGRVGDTRGERAVHIPE